MGRQVYVYCDEGCSLDSVKGWVTVLKQAVGHPEGNIHLTNCRDVEDLLTRQRADETTLIMPGGADVAYVKRLKRSIKTIQRVVREGGSYIGSCAGAYFASSECIFERDDTKLRVVGERELCLFPHAAIGAVRENFCYGSESGATMEKLLCEWRGRQFEAEVYCNGGPGWDVSEGEGMKVIARYTEPVLRRHGIENETPAAVVSCSYGRGSVVLSGVHPELDGDGDHKRAGRYELLAIVAHITSFADTPTRHPAHDE